MEEEVEEVEEDMVNLIHGSGCDFAQWPCCQIAPEDAF